jgi:RND family efflux transporter MFP subunit
MVMVMSRRFGIVAVALAVACGRDGTPGAPPPAAVESVWTVDTAVVDLPLSFPAQLYVEHDAAVAARAAGVVDSLFVDLGSRVEPGQLLARIESVDQEIALARAEAAADNSERMVARARGLSQVRGMTVADSEQAELANREAGLALRQARRALELTRVTAPFGGVVTARYTGPRRQVAAGDTLFRVAETGPLLARIRVPEAAAASLRLGANATVTTTGRTARARILRLAPAVDAGSGTREAILELDRTGGLLPGAAVSVRLGVERRRVIAAPKEAIGADGWVLVVDRERTALRAVVVGSDLGDGRVEITSGLRPGERLARPAR